MGNTFCEKHACICVLFTLVLFSACGYLFYAGWWLPLAINNHRLRHNQLIPFEIYTLALSDWYSYSMPSEGISMLTYRQQKEYEYKYLLGSFQPENFTLTDLNLIIDDTAPALSNNMSGLIAITWDSFTQFVDNDVTKDQLYITMYSATSCKNQANETEIYDCFNEWYDQNNATAAPEYYIYTFINDTIYVDANSIHASDVLDGPRDVFMFVIMMFCFIWFFLVIDFFEDAEIGWEAINYLIITLFFIGGYYLWIFVLSVIPVMFALPVGMEHIDYYRESLYSLTYVVGDYDPYWWVAGVLLNGIWAYAVVLFIPAIGILFLVIAAICCCDEKKTDTCGACVIIPVLLMSVCIIIIFTIGQYVFFVGNMVYWNTNTYNDLSDDNVIQAFTALLVLFVLLPLMGCCLSKTTQYSKKYEKKKKRKHMHRAGKSLQRLPIIKNRVSSDVYSAKVHDREVYDDEAVAMTHTGR